MKVLNIGDANVTDWATPINVNSGYPCDEPPVGTVVLDCAGVAWQAIGRDSEWRSVTNKRLDWYALVTRYGALTVIQWGSPYMSGQSISGDQLIKLKWSTHNDRDLRHQELPRPPICTYCGGPGAATEHIWPRSRGGDDHPNNTTPACRSCNSRKASKSILDDTCPSKSCGRIGTPADVDTHEQIAYYTCRCGETWRTVWNLHAAAVTWGQKNPPRVTG